MPNVREPRLIVGGTHHVIFFIDHRLIGYAEVALSLSLSLSLFTLLPQSPALYNPRYI